MVGIVHSISELFVLMRLGVQHRTVPFSNDAVMDFIVKLWVFLLKMAVEVCCIGMLHQQRKMTPLALGLVESQQVISVHQESKNT